MRLLALTRYPRTGASSRVRLLQYLPYLQAGGVDVDVRPLWTERYLADLYGGRGRALGYVAQRYLKRAAELRGARRHADLCWLEAELFPCGPPLEPALLGRYVVDYDDAVFHKYDGLPGLAGKIDRVMRSAALVVAGNEYVAARAALAGARRIEVLPSAVDVGRFPVAQEPPGPPRIGWIGTPHTAPYVGAIGTALARVCASHGATVVLVGASRAQAGLSDDVRVEEHPWAEATEGTLLGGVHVGIMPLPDRPWERGKSGYKLVQAMACARPVVASPVGCNADVVGDAGLLATSVDEWHAALCRLIDDAALRATLGARARRRVVERFSTDAVAPRLLAALRAARN